MVFEVLGQNTCSASSQASCKCAACHAKCAVCCVTLLQPLPHRYGQRYGWLLRTNFRRTLTLQQVGWALVGLGASYRCDSTPPSLKAVSRPVQATCLALALTTLHEPFCLPFHLPSSVTRCLPSSVPARFETKWHMYGYIHSAAKLHAHQPAASCGRACALAGCKLQDSS